MRKFMTALAPMLMAFVLIWAGSALYADTDRGAMMGDSMMGHGRGMMGMGRMGRMMDHCSAMMGGGYGHRPNDQWRQPAPENKG
jgi:hypothetical protein